MLSISNLVKSYGSLTILDDLSLSLEKGEAVALTGESGSGKSTLLHLIALLDKPDAGSIRLGGREVTGLPDAARAALRRSTLALVFQQFNLIPSLTIGANIAFQARLAGRFDPAWCRTLADRLGLADLQDRYPEQISGGQAQRTAVARAMAARPSLLLADEPTGNLDETTGAAVFDLMLELTEETGTTLLLVTHSAALAARLPRRLHIAAGRLA